MNNQNISLTNHPFGTGNREYYTLSNDLPISNIKIIDLIGKIVLQSESVNDKIDVQSLNPGMYYITITDSEKNAWQASFIKMP